mmetsp:Transcript_31945/g.71006  ORF Transcript_31945/g.71006 Transcript_31945/m.71006 type:complete len:691 (-) Transcript_31945:161-2233(-)
MSMAPSKKKGSLLKDQLQLEKYKTKDGKDRFTIRPVEEPLTFDKGFFLLVRALQLLRSSNNEDDVLIVGLGGPSGSGKTALSEKIKTFQTGVAVISMDMYNQGDLVIDDNFDDPRLTDYPTLLNNIRELRAGKPTQVPIYDFKQSKRVGYVTQEVPSSRIIIIEGIYALSEKLRPLLDLRVSITGGVHFDLVKRVMRDINRSGQGPEDIIQQIFSSVYPMYRVYVEPDLKTAQLRITNSFNPFTGFMSPSYVIKSAQVPDIDTVRKALEEQGAVVAQSTEEVHDIYLLPPNEDPETCQSWLRMRNREGRYSLVFEEWVVETPFIISPRISFEVNVRVLGGLMSLGYDIGAILKRVSTILTTSPGGVHHSDSRCSLDTSPAASGGGAAQGADTLTVKFDDLASLGTFIQIAGKDRARVAALGTKLGLDGTYIPHSYIEQVQLKKLTSEFTTVTEDWKRKFAASSGGVGSALLSDLISCSPPGPTSYLQSSPIRFRRASGEDDEDVTQAAPEPNLELHARAGSIASSSGSPDGPIARAALFATPPAAGQHSAIKAANSLLVSSPLAGNGSYRSLTQLHQQKQLEDNVNRLTLQNESIEEKLEQLSSATVALAQAVKSLQGQAPAQKPLDAWSLPSHALAAGVVCGSPVGLAAFAAGAVFSVVEWAAAGAGVGVVEWVAAGAVFGFVLSRFGR